MLDMFDSRLLMCSIKQNEMRSIGNVGACLMCGEAYVIKPFIGAPDPVCPECYNTYKDCAILNCLECRRTIAKIQPHMMENGYYVRPRSVLTIAHCPDCKEEGNEDIIEIANWERKYRPVKSIITPLKLD